MTSLYGRSRTNKIEPYFAGILNTLNDTWDSEKYKKLSMPVIEAIDERESYNQIKSKIYAY